MSHGHGHAHGHHGAGAHDVTTDPRKLAIALALIIGFMLVEVIAGIIAGSLALLSDAGHMLTDAAAIGLSLAAIRLAARPARGVWTYGLNRVEILSAQINGITLLVLGLLVLIAGVRRLVTPVAVEGGLMLAVALAGIAVNLAATWVLSGASRRSLNVEGSYQHLLTDLYAFIATAVAAGVIIATGFDRADAIASLLIAALMLRSAYGLLKATGRVLMEAAPEGIDPDEIGGAMLATAGVREVHDLHVWEVTSGFPALSAHVLVKDHADCHEKRYALERMLHERFGIDHSTLQVDHERRPELLSIEPAQLPEPRERA